MTNLLSRVLALSLPERRDAIVEHWRLTDPASPRATAHALVALAAALDVEGPRHTARVVSWTRAVALSFGMRGHALESCVLGAWLHDIGKLAVPDHVIHKPGLYLEDDWRALRVHSEIGARILDGAPGLEEAAEIVLCHHEHADGTGYPRGLRGEEIPLAARIFAVADSYDAMTRTVEREWGDPFSREAALADLSLARYDAACVRAFVVESARWERERPTSKSFRP